jgi:hypothetical protein
MTKAASITVAAAIPFVALAFWHLCISRPFASVDRYTHLHAAAGVLWLVLLIAQPAAIHARRVALHRLLGRISYLFAACFVVASILLSHHRLATCVAAGLVFTYRGPATARRALIGYLAAFVVIELGWFIVAPTPMWLEAVRWFRSPPLT